MIDIYNIDFVPYNIGFVDWVCQAQNQKIFCALMLYFCGLTDADFEV